MTHATQPVSTLTQLLSQLRRRNVRLWAENGRLRFRAPEGVMTSALLDQLRLHKTEILQFLQQTTSAPNAWTAIMPILEHTDTIPLTFAQERLWVLEQLQGDDNGAYHMSATFRLTGLLHVDALKASFERVIERHAILRTTFALENDTPVQRIAETGEVDIDFVNLPNCANSAATAAPVPGQEFTGRGVELACQSLITNAATAPFDLACGPLLRVHVIHCSPTEHLLTVAMHHIIADGWSIQILIGEISALYAAFVNEQPDPLPPLTIQYADYAHWQRNWLQGAWLERELVHWQTCLAGAPPLLDLPTDFPRQPVEQTTGGRLRRTLEPELAEELRNLARQRGATLFMVLLAAFKVLLARYSGQTDIVVGTPVAGRNHPAIEGLIGFFVNTLLLRTDLDGDPTFGELLARVRHTAIDAFAHGEVPFIKLVEQLQPERSPNHNPLYQVMFAFQEGPAVMPTLTGLAIAPVETSVIALKDDLFLEIEEADNGLRLNWEYSTDLFRRETIARMADHFALLLRAIVVEPNTPILALPMLTMEEEAQLLFAWNETDFPFDPTLTFQQLFEAQVTRTPDAIAVCYQEEQFTYAELNVLADRVADRLRAAGVDAESVVALLFNRSPLFLAATIALFKVGAAYLPLDVRAPAARQRQILAQSRTPLLLITEDFAEVAHETLALLAPDQRPRLLDLTDSYDLRFTIYDLCNTRVPTERATGQSPITNHQSLSSSLAYVIYTSGSTGLPKGAMVEQRGMINHLYAKIKDLKLTATDTVAQNAPQSFDISVWQFFAPLIVGGRVHIFPDEVAADPVALLRQTAANSVSVLEVVPSLLRLMVDELQRGLAVDLSRLRWLIPTGEALPPNLARQWLHLYPQIPLVNAYGPTECSDDVTHYFVSEPPAADVVNMPIGRPIINMRLYILDTHRQPVPVGVAGELYVGGVGVGRGYIHDPERTAQAFVPDPFSSDPHARLYKTGDKARYLPAPDGEPPHIEFLGRLDYQVKIRGFRIELGEIEAALERHPAVHQAIVMDHPDPNGNKRLIAYVVATPHSPVSSLQSSLRRDLGEMLPDYMVPAAFVVLDAMPLTPNGKVDRKTLPRPDAELWSAGEWYVAPATELQKQLVTLWADVLKLDPDSVGIEHNFFTLGGHSLLAVQIIARTRKQFDVELPIRTLLEQPTVAGMADALQAQFHQRNLLASVVASSLSQSPATAESTHTAEPTREVIEL